MKSKKPHLLYDGTFLGKCPSCGARQKVNASIPRWHCEGNNNSLFGCRSVHNIEEYIPIPCKEGRKL